MADFCKACSIETFGEDFDDLKGLIDEPKVQLGFRATALCEGCGMISVDHEGVKWTSEQIEGKWQWVKDKRLQSVTNTPTQSNGQQIS